MSLSSELFLFFLFPILIFLLWIGQKRKRRSPLYKKILVFFANTIFYIWGGIGMFLIALAITVFVWIATGILTKCNKKLLLFMSIFITALPLLLYKYLSAVESIMFKTTGINSSLGDSLVAITGISFLTFQAISLEIDVWKGELSSVPSFIEVFDYLLFFSTIVSGPIIRFNGFTQWIQSFESVNSLRLSEGLERISIGLAKKYLIANKLLPLVNYYFDGISHGLNMSTAGLWLGSIAYSLQLYFDFSGYSDIAIGVAQIIGYDIPDNFYYPYTSICMSDFWRRWHISLGDWFRDYVYIPLGGNRCNTCRNVLNLLIVWTLTGMWHGSKWTFVIWGMGHFLLLILEKYCKTIKKMLSTELLAHIYVLFFTNILWVVFRSESLFVACNYLKGMFGIGCVNRLEEGKAFYVPIVVVVAILCFIVPYLKNKTVILLQTMNNHFCISLLLLIRKVVIYLLLIMSIFAIFNAAYTPYIYGNF